MSKLLGELRRRESEQIQSLEMVRQEIQIEEFFELSRKVSAVTDNMLITKIDEGFESTENLDALSNDLSMMGRMASVLASFVMLKGESK